MEDRLMALAIRAATADEAGNIERLIERAYAPWLKTIRDLPDVSAGVLPEIEASRLYVVEENKTVSGALNVRHSEKILQVVNVAVDPDAAGRGIGRLLMDFADELARTAGKTKLALSTHKDMRGNVEMYEHLGWSVIAREGEKVLMQRDLSAD